MSAITLALVCTIACGRPKPEGENQPQKLEEPSELEAAAPPGREIDPRTRKWKRAPPPMPETFAGFPQPELATLDGVWIVDNTRPNASEVWVVEEQGSKLTIIDRQAREQSFDVTLSSPCALRLINDDGRASARAIALSDERLIVTSKGAIAIASAEGSLLACVGHRTYQIAADGRCRYTTEMLGAWSDPVEAKDACTLETVDGERVLIIAGQRLREHDGVWLDELAAASVAVRMEDRDAAIAAIAPKPAAAAEAVAATETGETR
jgi:hypothetical protein